jgi:hypothetical protein
MEDSRSLFNPYLGKILPVAPRLAHVESESGYNFNAEYMKRAVSGRYDCDDLNQHKTWQTRAMHMHDTVTAVDHFDDAMFNFTHPSCNLHSYIWIHGLTMSLPAWPVSRSAYIIRDTCPYYILHYTKNRKEDKVAKYSPPRYRFTHDASPHSRRRRLVVILKE